MANDKLALSLATHLLHDAYEFTEKRLSNTFRTDKDFSSEFIFVNLDIRQRIVQAKCDSYFRKMS